MTGWSLRQVWSAWLPGLVSAVMLLGLSGSRSMLLPTADGTEAGGPRAAQPGAGQVTRLEAVPVTSPTLWPGSGDHLDVVVVNRNPQPVVVTRMEVRVSQVHGPYARPALPCGFADFSTRPARQVELRVAPRTSASLSSASVPRWQWPWIGMVDAKTDQDGCQDVQLVLDVTVEGRPA